MFFAAKFKGSDPTVFLPGATTDGHYQIELACTACHAVSFVRSDDLQTACEGCHAEELDAARDSHPKSKFTDPRNADRTALLDARYCVTCHVEHRPEATLSMGLTLPEDFCGVCHADIAEERATHEGMDFDTCASAGCHNFHDNRALYEDFLLKHGRDPALLTDGRIAERNFASIAQYLETYPIDTFPLQALAAADADVPSGAGGIDAPLLADWADTSHAESGVNCSACHVRTAEAVGSTEAADPAELEGRVEDDHSTAGADTTESAWRDKPGYDSCRGCHVNESEDFVLGRHGMWLNAEANGRVLPPLRTAEARLPMKDPPLTDGLDCGSCHPAHRFDTVFASVEACLGCHDDRHSNAYVGSPHELIADQAEVEAEINAGVDAEVAPEGGGRATAAAVTCATCHMPRVEESYEWGAYVHVLVQHNQNDNLRPNEKMIRTVCMECHGLGFSIDALSDPALIDNNFRGAPTVQVKSIDLAEQRRREIERERLRNAGQAGSLPEVSTRSSEILSIEEAD